MGRVGVDEVINTPKTDTSCEGLGNVRRKGVAKGRRERRFALRKGV